MCTAITYQTDHFYFGRNLDLEYSYGEAVTIVPRNFPFSFRCQPPQESHYAIIGVAHIADGFPLYYDAVNEAGLCIAALHFPRSAAYNPYRPGAHNVAPFELIPWLLGQCADLAQARQLLQRLNLMRADFSSTLPCTPLHWLIADRHGSIVLEPTDSGLQIHENPIGILTNEPPFPCQMLHLSNFLRLSPEEPAPLFCGSVSLPPYSRGMGALGLPGDVSSASRFVRAAFTKLNSVSGTSENENVSQFFHILGSVEQIRGCVRLEHGQQEITVYSSCCNADKGIYYYTTYENRQITAVSLHRENLDGAQLVSYPLVRCQRICSVN